MFDSSTWGTYVPFTYGGAYHNKEKIGTQQVEFAPNRWHEPLSSQFGKEKKDYMKYFILPKY